ncbi:hypothetical protein AD006_21235 [Pseudonocardia sp. EC080610-09]|nr:hypothetical protein FRP1_13555 [Pseudonocardia sp. EC080625-04]ALL77206.1 hypothetical protein AD006_21235 [Pseudonocardia sp. EC080610-09]ALL80121.1 hypothetical protein AD017_00815 [Pseudonocardia sp. EC080619-01]
MVRYECGGCGALLERDDQRCGQCTALTERSTPTSTPPSAWIRESTRRPGTGRPVRLGHTAGPTTRSGRVMIGTVWKDGS